MQKLYDTCNSIPYVLNCFCHYLFYAFNVLRLCFICNWQVINLLYTSGVFMSIPHRLTFFEPRDFRVVFVDTKKAPRQSSA